MPFCRRYPDWPDNVERRRVNGPLHFWNEPLRQSLRKTFKATLTLKAVRETLFFVASILDRVAPDSSALERVYRLLLGAHIFLGYRSGLLMYESGADQTAQARTPELRNPSLVEESSITKLSKPV
jgi:hypothetical protein